MERRLEGKVAIVTGAGSGIGRATAALFGKEGATVVCTDVNREAVEGVAAEIVAQGGVARGDWLDVIDEAAWQRVVGAAVEEHGGLDVLVNCAGVSFARPIAEMTLDQWRRVMAINLDGVFLGTKHALLAMRRRGGGSIVNVASVSGIKPAAPASAYCASKAALRMFSKAAAIECADAASGVRVNLVSPGGVKTPMWESMEFFPALVAEHGGADEAFAAMAGAAPSQAFFSAEEVASTILYLACDESAHLSGIEVVMDRGHAG